MTINLPLS